MTDPIPFGEVDGLIDEQLYEHRRKANFDPHDNDEWCVSLTAKEWRTVERALAIANEMTPPPLSLWRNIQLMAAAGLEQTEEESPTWNLFAEIHKLSVGPQLASKEVVNEALETPDAV